MNLERYSRQEQLPYIGRSGQEKLLSSSAVIVGCGALGTHSAECLARSGVGVIRIIDPECIELSNLQRQCLFNESDVGAPKAVCAANRLSGINSDVRIEPVCERLTRQNAPELLSGADIVIDAVDNLASREEINRACVESGVPWIYGGIAGFRGMTMNVIPGGACFKCLMPGPPPDSEATADSIGIIGPLADMISAVQCAEAIKILVHGAQSASVRRTLLYVDLRENKFDQHEVIRLPNCPVCGGRNGN